MALASIEEMYSTVLTENSTIQINAPDEKQVETAQIVKSQLNAVIQEKQQELGTAHIRPLNLSREQADALRNAIKSDIRFTYRLNEIVEAFAPSLLQDFAVEDLATEIGLPWFNAAVAFRVEDKYDEAGDALKINGIVAHSYITQLQRSKKFNLSANEQAKDSMSISGIVKTSDDLLIVGVRAGQSYYDTIMTTPAGSVEYHSGKNPLFETFYAESTEELGLNKNDFSSLELIGRVFDATVSKNSLYVFSGKTNLTYKQALDVWEGSIDNREHKFLLAVQDDPEIILRKVKQNIYNAEKVGTPANKTTIENANTVLPPAAVSLLLYCIKNKGSEGPPWARYAEKSLSGAYKLS